MTFILVSILGHKVTQRYCLSLKHLQKPNSSADVYFCDFHLTLINNKIVQIAKLIAKYIELVNSPKIWKNGF